MSRNYGNFLLLSGLLGNVPDANTTIYNFARHLLTPRVKVVEADCGTQLGNIQPINDNLVGKTELLNGDAIIDSARLLVLKSLPQTTVSIRTLPTCVTSGGICQSCFDASYNTGTPAINSTQVITPDSTDSFFAYLGNSYSGSLVGIRPLPTEPLPVRKGVLDFIIHDTHLELVNQHVETYKAIPADYISYSYTIADKVERALFILWLYGVYASTAKEVAAVPVVPTCVTWTSGSNFTFVDGFWESPAGGFFGVLNAESWASGARPSSVTITYEVLQSEDLGTVFRVEDTNGGFIGDSGVIDNIPGGGPYEVTVPLTFTTFDIALLQVGNFGLYDAIRIRCVLLNA